MRAELFDDRRCELGEGAFWHPDRGQFFWFDILGRKLLSRVGEKTFEWEFDRRVSAAGWIDRDTLLVAGAGAMMTFDIPSGRHEVVCALEAERPDLRSNDGRADPHGGFWIGVMGCEAEPKAGAIWRFHRGELRRLYDAITIPNAISFTPDGDFAHFADTRARKVWRVRLGRDGWPTDEPEIFLDLAAEKLDPDGAVCDEKGNLWLALWGSGKVACHSPDGRLISAVDVPASQVTCPSFCGPQLDRLAITTAYEGLDAEALRREPQAGATFQCAPDAKGIPEHRVQL